MKKTNETINKTTEFELTEKELSEVNGGLICELVVGTAALGTAAVVGTVAAVGSVAVGVTAGVATGIAVACAPCPPCHHHYHRPHPHHPHHPYHPHPRYYW